MSKAFYIAIFSIGVASLGGCDFLRGYADGHSDSLSPYESQNLPRHNSARRVSCSMTSAH